MPDSLSHWHALDSAALAAGDAVAARRWAEAAVHDELQRSRLRALVHELSPGVELGQSSDHQLVDALVAALVSGRVQIGGQAQGRPLLALAPAQAASPAPPAPPPPSSASAASAPAAPAPAETTFGAELDAAAMAQALRDAASDGVPFCEECERARRQREAEAA